MEVLVINGHDYSSFVELKGLEWKRNDLDSDKTTRTKDGRMRRDKICTKRTVGYKLFNMTREKMAALDDDLSAATFFATYSDLHGTMTREFYCTSFSAQLERIYDDGQEQWGSATFNMIEV